MKKIPYLVVLAVVVLGGVYVFQQRKYANTDFITYKNQYLACRKISGATNTSLSYIYSQWKAHAQIGC